MKVRDFEKIDLVIPWVDGNDPAWKAERNEWKNKLESASGSKLGGGVLDQDANNHMRYQSWDNLQYWFRAVEQNLPWFNKIFFVTWGHVPDFLNTNHPKLRIVNHKDYIPAEYLPTFNSNTIEMNYHRIEDLSENFIMFNDDCFPLQPIDKSYYFQNDCICEEAIETPIVPTVYNDHDTTRRWACLVRVNDIMFINRHFKKREVQAKNYDKWFSPSYEELLKRNESMSYWNNFCGFRNPHLQNSVKKSTLKHLWDIEPDTLDRTSKSKFRGDYDVNQWLIRYWQICEGNFIPRKTLGKFSALEMSNVNDIAAGIRQKKWQSICINETCTSEEFIQIKRIINSALEEIFPDKSSFEL